MRSPALKQKVYVQTETTANELAGGTINQWTTVETQDADITPLRGREYEAAQQVQSGITHKIRTRMLRATNAPATTAMRLVTKFDSRVFHVQSVLNIGERNRWLEWMCEEGGVV